MTDASPVGRPETTRGPTAFTLELGERCAALDLAIFKSAAIRANSVSLRTRRARCRQSAQIERKVVGAADSVVFCVRPRVLMSTRGMNEYSSNASRFPRSDALVSIRGDVPKSAAAESRVPRPKSSATTCASARAALRVCRLRDFCSVSWSPCEIGQLCASASSFWSSSSWYVSEFSWKSKREARRAKSLRLLESTNERARCVCRHRMTRQRPSFDAVASLAE